MPALVIGCDEFLGAEVTRQLLFTGKTVMGISLQPYEQSENCQNRLAQLQQNANARHFQYVGNLASLSEEQLTGLGSIKSIFFLPEYDSELDHQEFVLHLSLKLLNICDMVRPRHLVFGSHYSIYPSSQLPCRVSTHTTHQPQSISSAIVHSIESLLHGFCAQKRLPCTVLRLFELYGQNATAMNLITSTFSRLWQGQEINLADVDNRVLDFVHVREAAKILIRAMDHVPRPVPATKKANAVAEMSDIIMPWQVFNLGTGIGTDSYDLMRRIAKAMNKPLKTINSLPSEQQNWVADPQELLTHMGLKPRTQLQDGLRELKPPGDKY